MIHVVVDTLAIQPNAGGIRVYLRELLKAAPAEGFRFTLICSQANQAAFSDLDVRICRIPWSARMRWLRVLTQQLLVPWIAWRRGADVLLAPVDIAPLIAPVPIVACVHSSHLNARHGYAGRIQRVYNRIFFGATVRRSRALIAISQYVSQATQEMFPAAGPKLRVIYHGGGIVERAGAAGWRPPADTARTGGILFVGTLHRYKRPDALLRAYSRLRRDFGDRVPPLLVAGDDRAGTAAWLSTIAATEGVPDATHLLGRVSDERLLELYSQCSVLVLPSAIEGFGLPVIEAMQAGLPVVISDLCALPEIAGGAALVASPDDVPELARAIGEALWNPQERSRLIAAGMARGRSFNWPRCAAETLSVLQSASRTSRAMPTWTGQSS